MLNYYPYQITQYSLMNIEIDKLFTMSNMSNMGTITKSTIHISFQIQLIFTVCFIEFVPISPFLFLSFSVCSLYFCFFSNYPAKCVGLLVYECVKCQEIVSKQKMKLKRMRQKVSLKADKNTFKMWNGKEFRTISKNHLFHIPLVEMKTIFYGEERKN